MKWNIFKIRKEETSWSRGYWSCVVELTLTLARWRCLSLAHLRTRNHSPGQQTSVVCTRSRDCLFFSTNLYKRHAFSRLEDFAEIYLLRTCGTSFTFYYYSPPRQVTEAICFRLVRPSVCDGVYVRSAVCTSWISGDNNSIQEVAIADRTARRRRNLLPSFEIFLKTETSQMHFDARKSRTRNHQKMRYPSVT